MVAPTSWSQSNATIAPQETVPKEQELTDNAALANGAAEIEPSYLTQMWSKSDDPSLTAKESNALKREYFVQFTKWKSFQASLATAIANLAASEFWNNVCVGLRDHGFCGDNGSFTKVEKVVCLCLGHLEDNAALYQLSLLILLLEKLGIDHEECSIFDPCHSSQEIDVLKHLGFTMEQQNTEAKIRVHQMTLFYMPHGDYILTDNLVGANLGTLQHIAILGNNFAWVCDENAADHDSAAQANNSASRAPHVQKVVALVKETHFQDTLAASVRSRVTTFAPRLSRAFGTSNSVCDALDCTLTTLPRSNMIQPVFLESAL